MMAFLGFGFERKIQEAGGLFRKAPPAFLKYETGLQKKLDFDGISLHFAVFSAKKLKKTRIIFPNLIDYMRGMWYNIII